MPHLLADRFLGSGERRVDLATGAPVRIRIAAAGTTAGQLSWNDWCAVVANLRHPLLNPLVDYGMADRTRTFEAYSAGIPVPAGGAAGHRLIAHAVRFLSAQGASLPRPLADYLLRPVVLGVYAGGPVAGVRLQPRAAMDAIREVIDGGGPPGLYTLQVSGEPRSGLRTLRLAAARCARLAGFVPVSARMLAQIEPLAATIADRHVCLLTDGSGEASGSLARMLIRLGAASPRRHVFLRFTRTPLSGRGVVIERMGTTALTQMLFFDGTSGSGDLAPGDLFQAARHSGGRPGSFLDSLAGHAGASSRRAMVVHETSPAYRVEVAAAAPPQKPGTPVRQRALARLQRAPERARLLARRGRHAAAIRLLRRALRVLAGRPEDAAQCAIELGSLCLERARIEEALESFGRAVQLARDGPRGVRAAIGLGAARMEAGHLIEAEATFRGALAAAESASLAVAEEAAAALARCLFWQARYDEGAALLARACDAGTPAPRGLVVLARLLLAEQSPIAVRTARRALDAARTGDDPQVLAAALRVMAQALASAGDPSTAAGYLREGLRTAVRAHLPLEAIRVRLAALEIQATAVPSPASRRLAGRLAAMSSRWPPLLRFHARAVRARVESSALDGPTRAFVDGSGALAIARAACGGSPNPVADLEALLGLGQNASDDRAALALVSEHLRARLRAATIMLTGPDPDRRVLTTCGDPWRGEPAAAWQALASGFSVGIDPRGEPCQAAEPLRFGGDVIGSLAARWVAGAAPDPGRTAALLRVGALAVAANVRGILDRCIPAPDCRDGDGILGDSAAARSMREATTRAARAPFPVLIEGESGSGKELVARASHRLGPRRERRFCAINCAALNDELLEAELFGHARGAFTGAIGERAGLFEDADGGTLFLDEIGELSPRAQAKLLRVLQDGQVRRVGENVSRRVDVRIVSATNRRLAEEAAAGRFRTDLRFRLDVVRIEVPPLRERASDVPLLAASFWTDAAARMGSRATLAPETLAALARYDWPGNVRELQNVIAWMAVHSPGRGRITPAAVPAHVAQAAVRCGSTFEAARVEFEKRFVKAALAAAGGHRARAAAALGISRQGLAKMVRRLALD